MLLYVILSLSFKGLEILNLCRELPCSIFILRYRVKYRGFIVSGISTLIFEE